MDLLTPGTGLIFWSTVVFLILFFVLKQKAWKPILQVLNEREASIASAIESAEKAKEEMAKIQEKSESLLQEARVEREKILKEATQVANQVRDAAKGQASEQATKIIEEAKAEIDNQKKLALIELKSQVAEISLEIAEKLLKENLKDDKAQQTLVSKFVTELDNN